MLYLLYCALLTVPCFTYCTVLYLLYYLGGYGSSGSSQENISSKVYSSANYNTIMVEFENGNRYNSSSPVISSYFTKLHYMLSMFSIVCPLTCALIGLSAKSKKEAILFAFFESLMWVLFGLYYFCVRISSSSYAPEQCSGSVSVWSAKFWIWIHKNMRIHGSGSKG